jgi:hypothetical protein
MIHRRTGAFVDNDHRAEQFARSSSESEKGAIE